MVMPLSSLRDALLRPRPLLAYAASWTALLAATVAVASFSPEAAFAWAVAPSSSFSRACECLGFDGAAYVRVPGDVPSDVACIPAGMFGRSGMDYFVPPVFAAVVVACAAAFVRAIGLWEVDEDEDG